MDNRNKWIQAQRDAIYIFKKNSIVQLRKLRKAHAKFMKNQINAANRNMASWHKAHLLWTKNFNRAHKTYLHNQLKYLNNNKRHIILHKSALNKNRQYYADRHAAERLATKRYRHTQEINRANYMRSQRNSKHSYLKRRNAAYRKRLNYWKGRNWNMNYKRVYGQKAHNLRILIKRQRALYHKIKTDSYNNIRTLRKNHALKRRDLIKYYNGRKHLGAKQLSSHRSSWAKRYRQRQANFNRQMASYAKTRKNYTAEYHRSRTAIYHRYNRNRIAIQKATALKLHNLRRWRDSSLKANRALYNQRLRQVNNWKASLRRQMSKFHTMWTTSKAKWLRNHRARIAQLHKTQWSVIRKHDQRKNSVIARISRVSRSRMTKIQANIRWLSKRLHSNAARINAETNRMSYYQNWIGSQSMTTTWRYVLANRRNQLAHRT